MTVAKLFARIGVKADSAKVENFTSKMDGAKMMLGSVIGVALLVTAELKKITDEVFNTAAAFRQFEAETGKSSQQLQRWQMAATATNQSAQAVTASIKSIVANQEKIKLGEGNISGFQLLGIDPRQDPFDILEELRVKTKTFSQAQKKEALGRLGISSELIQVIDLTKEKFDELSGSAFLIPEKNIKSMADASGSIQQVANAIKWLKSLIASELAPGIARANKEIIKWIKTNKDGIVKTLKTVFDIIGKVSTAVKNSALAINEVIVNTVGWENAVKGLLAILAILNIGIIASPIGLLIAGLVLLVAVLDDLYVYSQGKGRSLFGVLMSTFPEFEKKMKGFFSFVGDSISLLKSLFSGDEIGIEKMIKRLGGVGVGIVALFNLIKITFDFAGASVKTLASSLMPIIKIMKGSVDMLTGQRNIREIFADVKDAFENIGKVGVTNFQEFGQQAMQSLQNIQNAFDINITIDGAEEPEKVARLVQFEFEKNIIGATSQMGLDQ